MPRPLVLAHRGARRVAPENTVEAFRAAVALGADGVELDVRRTADGVLVVHHDPGPEGSEPISALPFPTLRARHPSIPTLTDALDAVAGSLVNIEIKNLPWEPGYDADEMLTAEVAALLDARGGSDRVLVSSFHLDTIDRFRALRPQVPTGALFAFGADLVPMATLIAERGHTALHPALRSLQAPTAGAVVEQAHSLGLAVNVWTVNEAEDLRLVAALGVDGVVTDVPDVALEVFNAQPGGSTSRSASGS